MQLESELRLGNPSTRDYTATANRTGGEVLQLADGQAAVMPRDIVSGRLGAANTRGIFEVQKAANIVMLDGGRAYWDHSANKVTFKRVDDRDFYLGRVVGDAAATDTTCHVNLNVDPAYTVDALKGPINSVQVGTAAAGGFGPPLHYGGVSILQTTATNEAQKNDLLTVDGFATAAPCIVEAAIRVINDGAGSAADFSIGLASGTHATDASAIAQRCFFHLDANNTAILAESSDGTTTVALTDTTTTAVEGSAVANRRELWIDARDKASVKLYVDGVRVLPNSTFVLTAAAGPLFLLAHLEKTSSTDVYMVAIDKLCARLMEQATE